MFDGDRLDVDQALAVIPVEVSPNWSPDRPTGPAPLDLASRVERASRYLAAMPPAISGSGGHAAAFRAALVLVRGFQLPPDEALKLLAQDFSPRCQPPWSLWELKHKVQSAATRARVPAGWLLNARRERTRP